MEGLLKMCAQEEADRLTWTEEDYEVEELMERADEERWVATCAEEIRTKTHLPGYFMCCNNDGCPVANHDFSRPCKYWQQGTCRDSKCTFRHDEKTF